MVAFDTGVLSAMMDRASIPNGIFEQVSGLRDRVSKWDHDRTLAILAGLQLCPQYQANAVRLELATRMVIVTANGGIVPNRGDLWKLLNRDLARSGSALLEDPVEDFFVTPVCTSAGEFHILEGPWEKAALHTEDLIEAFEKLPADPIRDGALAHVYAALSVSQILVKRAGLRRFELGGGDDKKDIPLPAQRHIDRIASLGILTWEDIRYLPFEAELLDPFVLADERRSEIGNVAPGDSHLEFQPFTWTAEGLVVALPCNISTCVRALLIDCAVQHGMEKSLSKRLLDVQAARSDEGGITRLSRLPVLSVKGQPVRQSLYEESAGRYVHLLQVVDPFDDWPNLGFGNVVPDNAGTTALIVESAKALRKLAMQQENFREGISFVVLGGWGRARALSVPHDPELRDWGLIFVEPRDAATIGISDNTNMADLWRLKKLESKIEEQGFELFGANGLLNLFALWKETDYTLIPERLIDLKPPSLFNFPTDLLFKVRQEAARRDDRRSILHPDGNFRKVARLDRSNSFDKLEPIYASLDDVRKGELIAACLHTGYPVWLHLNSGGNPDRSFDEYETWRAALKWLSIVLPPFLDRYRDPSDRPLLIEFKVEWPEESTPQTATDEQIDGSIVVKIDDTTGFAKMTLRPDWQRGLRRANNYAEVSLAVTLLATILDLSGKRYERRELSDLVVSAVGSDDIRWRHSFIADRPVTQLRALGLLPKFQRVSPSAIALAKCGAVFRVRDRSEGNKILGADACFEFLMAHNQQTLQELCSQIASFDRQQLVTKALAMMQSAEAEGKIWALSARALRAIYGSGADDNASFEERSKVNAVIRGCSILAEMAASHGALTDGRDVGTMDLDDLLALALLHFQGAELIPPIRGGFLKARIDISPTGDILYDHGFGEATLELIARIRHTRDRISQSDEYHSFYEDRTSDADTPASFLEAIEAEFELAADAYFSLSGALCSLAIENETPTLVIRESELIARLSQLQGYTDLDLRAALRRLTLACRPSWTDIPVGGTTRNYDLSKFDRPHSLIGRPIVAISSDEDPLLVVAPAVVERSVAHNLGGAYSGSLQGEFWSSKMMRKFVGGKAEKLGMEFNDRVAASIADLGLSAIPSMKPSDCLNHKATDGLKRLGDIDVLVVTEGGKHVWVVEAKDIRFCRTLAETASRLSEYRGVLRKDGKPDNLLRHLQRVEYVRAHASDLAKRMKLPTVPKVHGLVIVDSPQPMAFLPSHPSTDARTMMLSDLAEVPWTKGWRAPPADRPKKVRGKGRRTKR